MIFYNTGVTSILQGQEKYIELNIGKIKGYLIEILKIGQKQVKIWEVYR